jgi:MerR family mercuric resistance operon transcriptional regulator
MLLLLHVQLDVRRRHSPGRRPGTRRSERGAGRLGRAGSISDEDTINVGLRSGDVAAAAGVNRQTLRYYERRGLLAEPDRSLGGHRVYPPETVTTLRVIKAAQRLGFTLDEVAELLDAGRRHRHRRPRQHGNEAGLAARAQLKLAEVEAKITDLQAIADTLRAAVDAGCDDLVECANNACCPIPFASIAGEQPSSLQRFEQRGAASKIVSVSQVGERAEDGAHA